MNQSALFTSHIIRFFRSLLGHAFSRNAASGGISTSLRRLRVFSAALRFQRTQACRRARAEREGKTVPAIIIASVTRRCNLNCAGCYSRELRGADAEELSDDRFMEIFREGIDLGVGSIFLAGGEPLLRRELIQRLAALRGPLMPVFTNGTLLDEKYFSLFSSSGLVPIFSIEGESSFTAERRGLGIHEGVIEKSRELQRRGILFGYSITLTSGNAGHVLSPEFLRRIEASGAAVLFLVEYVPVSSGTENLVLTDEQKSILIRPDLFRPYRFSVVTLPGDEEQYGGCLAAGRGFIHISDDGKLEACPFAPFSDSGVAEQSLAAALASPLMQSIRERHSELTETSGGCALWNKKAWIAELSNCAPSASSLS